MSNGMISSKVKVKIFSIIVTSYMLAALAWWAILLCRKTETIYQLKLEMADLYPNAAKELTRQHWMITSETLVFAASMILGIYFLNRAFRREMIAVKQQKNFLLSVTHELKSPITAIQLILDTFKKRKLDEKQFSILIENGQEETTRLKKLVEDLLTAARLNPKTTLRRENIDLWKTIAPLINQYEKNYPELNFQIDKKNTPYAINTNEPSLYLIVSNLVDNAVKYSNSSHTIKLTLNKRGKYISLKVYDNGKGIPDEEKARIFDQFYRIGDENIRTAQGTGLGLFLVKELCTKLDIKVEVVDNQPTGSVFELLIPSKE